MADKKRSLTRARVLAAALELVDAEGLEALSMRKLGERLGVEGMALYRHVANKSDLLDGVFEAVLTEMRAPARTGDWRTDVRAMARAFEAALIAHPRALPLFASRPAVSPASLEVVEAAIGVLVQAGLPLDRALLTFDSVVALVVGHCLAHYGPADAHAPVDYAALDPARFPHLSRLPAVLARLRPEDALDLALELLIAGIGDALGPDANP